MTKIKGSLLFKMKTEIAQSTMYFYRKKSSNVLSIFKYNSLMNFPINQLLCIHCNVSCPSGIQQRISQNNFGNRVYVNTKKHKTESQTFDIISPLLGHILTTYLKLVNIPSHEVMELLYQYSKTIIQTNLKITEE